MYIPDMTERFPEGMRGIDMTPAYFGEPVDYNSPLDYEEVEDDFLGFDEDEDDFFDFAEEERK